MQRAEARVPRRLNPPTLPESTHHSFLIRGISREHENSERKEGVNGRQKPVEFLLSSDSMLVNHDIYIYIYFRSNPRETQGSPLIAGGVCVLSICQRVIIDCEIKAILFSSSSSSVKCLAESSIYFGFIPGTGLWTEFCADIIEERGTVTSYRSMI